MLVKNPSTTAPGQLSDNYYLDNFSYLIGFVEQHYTHLLSTQEVQLCADFKTLSDDARKLYVRLALRTPDLLRLSKLQYSDIGSIPTALKQLNKNRFISLNIQPDMVQCQTLFSQSELKSAGVLIARERYIDSGHNDSGYDDSEPTHWSAPDLFGQSPFERLLESDNIIQVHHKMHIVTFRLLFFGNLHQDFSSIVLRDLGLRRYESYTIDSDTLLFQTREQLQAHLDYYLCAESFDAACELGSSALTALHKQLPAKINGDRSLTRRLDNLNNKIARQLEREASLTDAVEIYSQTNRPPSRERLARINAKLGHTDAALAVCNDILDAPTDTDELDFAKSFGHRIANKAGRNFAELNRYTPPQSHLTLAKLNLNVEFSVALHLAKTGKCYYLENTLLGGVFGLAFWDIIFAPVKGVFFHPFQSKPADFYEPEFNQQRAAAISQRLAAIINGDLHHYAFKHLFEKHGISNPLIHWSILRPHILSLAIKRIPANDWHAIFELLLSDIRNYRAGQPDLAYFPDDGGYQLLEVKAPGDRLQKNQLRWMRFFKQQNINHGVVHVEWQESGPGVRNE